MWYDLRAALRAVLRQKRATAVVLLCIGLSSGAGSVVSALAAGVLGARIPGTSTDLLLDGFQWYNSAKAWSFPEARWIADHARMATWTAFSRFPAVVSTPVGDRSIWIEGVMDNYADVSGQGSSPGRWFAADETNEQERVALIVVSAALCKALAPPLDCVGTRLRVRGTEFTVVGVAHQDFRGLSNLADAWVPLPMSTVGIRDPRGDLLSRPMTPWLALVGRLRRPADSDAAARELRTLGETFVKEHWVGGANVEGGLPTYQALPLRESRTDPRLKQAEKAMDTAVVCLIALGCTTALLLFVADLERRRHEFAVQLAVGAHPSRILRTTVMQVVLVGAGALFVGELAAAIALRIIGVVVGDTAVLRAAHTTIALDAVQVSAASAGWSLSVGFLLVCAVAAVLALELRRTDIGAVSELLRAEVTGSRGSLRIGGKYGWIIAIEIAAASTLAAWAATVSVGYYRLITDDLGFVPEDAISVTINAENESVRQRAVEVLKSHLDRTVPSARFATVSCLPFSDTCTGVSVFSGPASASAVNAVLNVVDGSPIDSLGLHLLAGRGFEAGARDGTKTPVVVSRRLADELGPGNVVGHTIVIGAPGSAGQAALIIGVVADVKYGDPVDAVKPTIYVPVGADKELSSVAVLRVAGVRTSSVVQSILALRNESLTPAPLDVAVARARSQQALQILILAAFSSIGLIIAVGGLSAVLYHVVRRSLREIGIRIALGATQVDILTIVLARAALFVGLGAALCIMIVIYTRSIMSSLVYQPSSFNTWAGWCAIAGVASASLMTSGLVAGAATRTSPSACLRNT